MNFLFRLLVESAKSRNESAKIRKLSIYLISVLHSHDSTPIFWTSGFMYGYSCGGITR